MMFEVW